MHHVRGEICFSHAKLAEPFQRNAIQFHTMVNQPVAKSLGNLSLQFLNRFVVKFDDLAGFDVDQMIMMLIGRRLVARAAIPKIMPFENAGIFEKTNGAIDGGDRNAAIDCRGPPVQLLHIGMIAAVGKNASDHAALLGNPQALRMAQRLDVDHSRHEPGTTLQQSLSPGSGDTANRATPHTYGDGTG